MKYVFIDERTNNYYNKDFDSLDEAISTADTDFAHLTDREKSKVIFFGIIESQNPDEEAPDHCDGNVVYQLK